MPKFTSYNEGLLCKPKPIRTYTEIIFCQAFQHVCPDKIYELMQITNCLTLKCFRFFFQMNLEIKIGVKADPLIIDNFATVNW